LILDIAAYSLDASACCPGEIVCMIAPYQVPVIGVVFKIIYGDTDLEDIWSEIIE
jgi:hypothetical protein